MRSHSHLNTAIQILQEYDGRIPFASFIKNFFKEGKKYGSKDRKTIQHLCYSYFRLGNAFSNLEMGERILTGVFLTASSPMFVMEELRHEWNKQAVCTLQEKLAIIGGSEEVLRIFPFIDLLSPQIEPTEFSLSHLIQPRLFLRLRPGFEEKVRHQLDAAYITYENISASAVAMAPTTKLEDLVMINTQVVVQDISSQEILDPLIDQEPKLLTVWDCCAASGGKSLLAYDKFPGIRLTVSDVRESILHNLRKRFSEARIVTYRSFVADLSLDFGNKELFDLVICDAPCSGSGTWSRTPEHLSYFKLNELGRYTSLQKSISINSARSVKKGGYFVYCTCSVFAAENEDIVQYIKNSTNLELVSSGYHRGYSRKADTLFTALFRL